LLFEHRIKAIVQRKVRDIRDLEVVVDPGGIVTIFGNVTSENEKIFIEQRVRALPEVQDVVNKIKVIQSLKEHR
jgi:osmotically-inducible protein OsmY